MRQLRPAVARPHRVTELLVGVGPASLRADMEDHARGQPMSPALWEEVLSYSLAKIDETWVEAAHRDISSHNKRAPASKLPFASASQRVGSILDSLDAASMQDRADFCAKLQRCLAIGQLNPSRARRLQGRRMKFSKVAAMVYRTDDASLVDWSSDLQGLTFYKARKTVSSTQVSRLQVEYLRALVK
jgi:hypothetical protein